jgi:hypothetical protein
LILKGVWGMSIILGYTGHENSQRSLIIDKGAKHWWARIFGTFSQHILCLICLCSLIIAF